MVSNSGSDSVFSNPLADNASWRRFGSSAFLIAPFDSEALANASNLFPQMTYADQCEFVAQHVLKNWSRVTDPTGLDLPYSQKMAAIALQTNPTLAAWVIDKALETMNVQ